MALRVPRPLRSSRPILVVLALGLMAWALSGETRAPRPGGLRPLHPGIPAAFREASRP